MRCLSNGYWLVWCLLAGWLPALLDVTPAASGPSGCDGAFRLTCPSSGAGAAILTLSSGQADVAATPVGPSVRPSRHMVHYRRLKKAGVACKRGNGAARTSRSSLFAPRLPGSELVSQHPAHRGDVQEGSVACQPCWRIAKRSGESFQRVGGALVRSPENLHIVSSGSGRRLASAPETKPERP